MLIGGKVLRFLVALVVALALPLQELAAAKNALCHALEHDAAASLAQDVEATLSADKNVTKPAADAHCGPSVNTTVAAASHFIAGLLPMVVTTRAIHLLAGIPAGEIDHPPLAI